MCFIYLDVKLIGLIGGVNLSLVSLLDDLIGSAGKYELIYYIFGAAFVLICIDLIFTFIFAGILSLFRR